MNSILPRFLLALTTALTLTTLYCQAESFPTDSTALPGVITVELAAQTDQPTAAAYEALGHVRDRLRVTSISSFLDPHLLAGLRNLESRKVASGSNALDRLRLIVRVHYTAPLSPVLAAAVVGNLPGIAFAEVVHPRRFHFRTNDPGTAEQWYLEGIHAVEAWDVARGDSSVVVAVVDTGVDMLHPDLRGAIWTNPGESGRDPLGRDRRTNGVDDDGNGLVDDWHGYDFAGNDGDHPDNDPSPGYWHGTHVAGTIGATGNNATGIAGVAWGVRLMPVKISDDATSAIPVLSNGFSGILYAATMHAAVINCSWGGPGYSRAEQQVIDAAESLGSLVVASAGNESADVDVYPAAYRGVVSVASVGSNDVRSSFTNVSSTVDISAPGSDIYATLPIAFATGSGYGRSSGTSMAAAIVSGAAALLKSTSPSLTPERIGAILRATATRIDDRNPDVRLLLGSGRLDIDRAIRNATVARLIDIDSVSVVDASGDGAIDPGERASLRLWLRNELTDVKDLRIDIDPEDHRWLTAPSSSTSIAIVASGDRVAIDSNSLLLSASPDCPIDALVPVDVWVIDGSDTIGATRLELTINPNWATLRSQRMSVSIGGDGRIGFDDVPWDRRGIGFHFDHSDNLLAEAGLILGTGPDRLPNVIRDTSQGQARGLASTRPFRVRPDGVSGPVVGTAEFGDAVDTIAAPLGVRVSLEAHPVAVDADAGALLLQYRITNASQTDFDSLFVALYADWDLSTDGSGDLVEFDPVNRLGRISSVRDVSLPRAALMLVSDQPLDFTAFDNVDEPLAGGFTEMEKWMAISRGVERDRSSIGDASMAIGAGPIALRAGEDTTVALAMIAGSSDADLAAAASAVRGAFERSGGRAGGPIELPSSLALSGGRPDPFAGSTRIDFEVPSDAHTVIDVFDALGRHIAVLVDRDLPRGSYSTTFAPPVRQSAIYFVRLRSAGERRTVKIMQSGSR